MFASTTVVRLGELDPTQVKVAAGEDRISAVSITTTNNRKAINCETHGEFGKSWKAAEACIEFVQDDEGKLAERFAKALRHAVALSGGKSSTF